jgi:hypothetical protein
MELRRCDGPSLWSEVATEVFYSIGGCGDDARPLGKANNQSQSGGSQLIDDKTR